MLTRSQPAAVDSPYVVTVGQFGFDGDLFRIALNFGQRCCRPNLCWDRWKQVPMLLEWGATHPRVSDRDALELGYVERFEQFEREQLDVLIRPTSDFFASVTPLSQLRAAIHGSEFTRRTLPNGRVGVLVEPHGLILWESH